MTPRSLRFFSFVSSHSGTVPPPLTMTGVVVILTRRKTRLIQTICVETFMEISERNKMILKEVIDHFIAKAEPVGSTSISRKRGINLSPATIRNAMSDLEAMGYLTHPHTSAGRVPTTKGYRYYLNCILKYRGPSEPERAAIEGIFSEDKSIEETLQGTSRVLSDLSCQASIVMTPRFSNIVFKHIEFVKMGRTRLLALMISRTGVIIKKIFETDEDIRAADLEKVNNYLNSILEGLTLAKVKKRIFEEMRKEKALYDSLMARALELGARFMDDQEEQEECDFFIGGTTNILGQPEFADITVMKRLFNAFEEKSTLLKLLDECVRSDGLNVWIGDESGIPDLEGLCLVTYPYGREDSTLGCIGVLGPTRMDYSRVIPLVEYTANRLSKTIMEA